MKEIIIKIKMTQDKMATMIDKQGFPDDMASILQMIGVLENLKLQEIDKLKNLSKEKRA